ncbi:MAG: flagellar motor switch protein FliM [Deltaproteobacteria bacterium]
MGDILSQNEIDELLKALNTGEIDVHQMKTANEERKVKNHDFRKPNKFAKDHLRTLEIIHENYARLITNFLSGYLRALVQVEVISVEELSYYEFNNSISNPAVLGIVDFSPLSGSVILEIAPNIVFALIDRILGGKGSSMQKVREYTEIELAIIERIITQLLNLMREPWENVTQIKPKLDKIETNAQFAQVISPNEMIALITLSCKIGEIEGMINICIPYPVLETVIPKLSTKFWFSMREKAATEESKESLERKIESTIVPIRVVLGNAELTVGEVAEIQIGDVIQLDTNVNKDLMVYIGEIYKFNARPGVKKSRVSVKVTGVIREEDENG